MAQAMSIKWVLRDEFFESKPHFFRKDASRQFSNNEVFKKKLFIEVNENRRARDLQLLAVNLF